ncbi:MAG: uncharacterized protein JWL60_2466 [Gemmatimonadetes bacterium]|jgi:hypothetical protein|nr:uncharacterized protein [Gemmatimonadota bacterium]
MPGSSSTRDEVLQWAHELYERAIDQRDADAFAAAFTPDAWLRLGNQPATVSREAIRAAMARFFATMVSVHHEPAGTWLDHGTLMLEAMVTFQRHDGRRVTVPTATILRLTTTAGQVDAPPLADQCRIFVDLSPLFEA